VTGICRGRVSDGNSRASRFATEQRLYAARISVPDLQIIALRANHSCSVLQCMQYVREKNTGMDENFAGSTSMPVGISRPVTGHLIKMAPISKASLATRPFCTALPWHLRVPI